jgi:hypothetical protein
VDRPKEKPKRETKAAEQSTAALHTKPKQQNENPDLDCHGFTGRPV